MQEVDLINQDELDKNLTILNNEFEQLIQNDFNQNESVISFADWLEEYLKFVDEVKDGKTYLKKILEYGSFFDQVITKYPFCLNENLFDPKSMFSENELIIWNSTIKYFQDYKNQNEKLKKVSEDLMFDLYFTKLNRLDLISSKLIDVLNLRKQINNECIISDEMINHLCKLTENSSQSKFSNRIEILEATENQKKDLSNISYGGLNQNLIENSNSADIADYSTKDSNKTTNNREWNKYFTEQIAYDLFLDCVEKLPNTGRDDTSVLVKYALIYHFFHNNSLIFEHINHKAFMKYLTKEHEVKFSDNENAFPKSRSLKNELNIKLLFKERFPTRVVK